MLHHERKAPIPSPGQPNRSTRFLYRPNIVAGCVVVRCGRRKPVCVTILQHRTLKHTVFRKSSPRFVAHPGRISRLVRWNALHNWQSRGWNVEIFHAATHFTGCTTQADHGPICAERARGERRKYQGLGKLRHCLVRSTLQTTWNSYQRKQNPYCQLYHVACRKNYHSGLAQELQHGLITKCSVIKAYRIQKSYGMFTSCQRNWKAKNETL